MLKTDEAYKSLRTLDDVLADSTTGMKMKIHIQSYTQYYSINERLL